MNFVFDELTDTVDSRFMLIDTFMYDIKTKAFFIADTHIGLEEYYFDQGVALPRTQVADLIVRLKKAFDEVIKNFEIFYVILLGDVKHEFGKISRQEWFDTQKFIDFISKKCENAEIILIKGNHDTVLEPITRRKEMRVYNSFKLNDLFLVHGDVLIKPFEDTKYVVMGHEHPAISLRKMQRVEKFKCFLFGESLGKKLIVLPSAHNLTTGTDILRERIMSPFFSNIQNFDVVVVSEKPYYLHKVKDVLKIMQG